MSVTPFQIGGAMLYLGDCREVMTQIPDASVDAVVTDPPYELGFMGKGWDSTGIANNVGMWQQCLRVLKPGGHLLAFSGSRTYHRMACAIEDAGFELRDQIMWIYGSGFPKSLDVSKAIDKARHDRADVLRATAWLSQHTTARALDDAAGTNGMGSHWTTQCAQAAIPTAEAWERIKHLFPAAPEWFTALIKPARQKGDAWDRRRIIGRATSGASNGSVVGLGSPESLAKEYDITAPATDASRQWEGWGTALKPAHEPICVARKPLVGTVAANVLAHGTGALNIDACRVPLTIEQAQDRAVEFELGRWPANVIHDGSPEVLAVFPDAPGQQGDLNETGRDRPSSGRFGDMAPPHAHKARIETDKSAARFFYCAKASRADRNDGVGGSDAPAVETNATMRERENADWPARNGNHHPTVKPIELMAYLCRLVTPPGGTVLDPFMGSGSTGKAAMREGFRFIGIDVTQEYVEIARARIAHELARVEAEATARAERDRQQDLFADVAPVTACSSAYGLCE